MFDEPKCAISERIKSLKLNLGIFLCYNEEENLDVGHKLHKTLRSGKV